MIRRILAPDSADLFDPTHQSVPWKARGEWPCRWIAPAEPIEEAFVFAARCVVRLDTPLRARIRVTADERYELLLNGQMVGLGPEIGERTCWFFDSYELDLPPGEHILVARVWGMGQRLGRWAMGSVRPGFLLCPEDERSTRLLGTGVAPWEARILRGYHFISASDQMNTLLGGGAAMEMDAAQIDWAHTAGQGEGWTPAQALHHGNNGFYLYVHRPAHHLQPAALPPQLHRPWDVRTDAIHAEVHSADWARTDALSESDQSIAPQWPATVPPRTCLRVVLELSDYGCFYPVLHTQGGRGASVELRYAETLFRLNDGSRGKHRPSNPAGSAFVGFGDRFLLDGADREFRPFWWRCGRFVEVIIRTAEEAATIAMPQWIETRYPFEPKAQWTAGDPALKSILAICTRSLQACMHETFVDCPYYEQLMYAGDTRVQMLIQYTQCTDDRLARKALRMFDRSRANCTGLPTANTPAAAGQMIPPFSLWWISAIHDFLWWRGDLPWVRTLLPGARAVLEQFIAGLDPRTGLFRSMPGWNYVDTAWPHGVPTDAAEGFSAVINLQLVLALRAMADLEQAASEPELAARAQRLAEQTAAAIREQFWDTARGILWDDRARTTASQHAQCLGLLSDTLTGDNARRSLANLCEDPHLLRARPYFMHYLFEAFARAGQGERVLQGIGQWRRFIDLGMKTTPEHFEDGRSDCHAWSAHPAYHLFASIAGIRPAAPGFARVCIRPQIGSLPFVQIRMPHPRGPIEMSISRHGDRLEGVVELPEGIAGELVLGNLRLQWPGGRRVFCAEQPLSPVAREPQ